MKLDILFYKRLTVLLSVVIVFLLYNVWQNINGRYCLVVTPASENGDFNFEPEQYLYDSRKGIVYYRTYYNDTVTGQFEWNPSTKTVIADTIHLKVIPKLK